jgi:hypothetical protein
VCSELSYNVYPVSEHTPFGFGTVLALRFIKKKSIFINFLSKYFIGVLLKFASGNKRTIVHHHIVALMMGTEMVSETSVILKQLTGLISRYCINVNRHGMFAT